MVIQKAWDDYLVALLKINAAQNGRKLAVVGVGEEGYDHFDKLLKRNEEVGNYVYLR